MRKRTAHIGAALMLSASGLVATAAFAGPAQAQASYGNEGNTLQTSDSTVEAGDTITVSGSGFLANSEVAIRLVRAGQTGGELLATVTTDGQGAFSAQVTIPGDTRNGSYTLAADGLGANGEARTITTPLVVGSLPFTGAAAVVPFALLGGGGVAVGSALIIGGLRMRREQSA